MKSIVITIVVTLAVTLLLALTFAFSGMYNVSASASHTGPVKAMLSTFSDRSITTHARAIPPAPALDSGAVLEGAEHFHAKCVICHGAPGVARDEFAEGLNPRAPELSRRAAKEFSEAQLFWIIRNGIKFTGMPAFDKSHTDEQIWAMARFVKRLDGMTDAQYEAVIKEVMAQNGGVMPGMTVPHQH